MSLELHHVDAFADRPFGGNPAAVCLLPRPADAAWMQRVAAEMNLSETSFITPTANGLNLRWFTPGAEVDLCGHATLAGAHVLWETGRLDADQPAVFHTRSGALTCTRDDEGWISMDFPARPATPCDAPAGFLDALGTKAMFIGNNGMDFLVHAPSEETVRSLNPDFRALKAAQARGVIVTAASATAGFDFISRFFAPAVGVDEDPVTGSAHCCLAPYCSERLGRNELIGYQASKRGGNVRVIHAGDRVMLIGQAVTVMKSQLLADCTTAPTVAAT